MRGPLIGDKVIYVDPTSKSLCIQIVKMFWKLKIYIGTRNGIWLIWVWKKILFFDFVILNQLNQLIC